jgi:hypothetical protein
MTDSSTDDGSTRQESWDIPKVRRCLRCSTTFSSQWSGERICSRCKSSNAWRSGTPPLIVSPSKRG